jgi:hypothetical protein
MNGAIFRLIFLAPAVVFGLGAAFVAARTNMAMHPADPAAWQAFLTLAPIGRDPAFLIADDTGLGYPAALGIFVAAALATLVVALRPVRNGRSRFVLSHLAMLVLLCSVARSGAFMASADGALPVIGWTVNFGDYPQWGLALAAVVLVACVVSHFLLLGRLMRNAKARSRAQSDLAAALGAFD